MIKVFKNTITIQSSLKFPKNAVYQRTQIFIHYFKFLFRKFKLAYIVQQKIKYEMIETFFTIVYTNYVKIHKKKQLYQTD